MTTFTLQDMGRVEWGSTFKLAFARSLAAAAVWAIVLAATGARLDFVLAFFLAALFLPFAALMQHGVIGAMRAVFRGLGIGVGVLACNFAQLATSIAVAIGDPIVFILNKQFPHVLNIAEFKFLNLESVIFMLRDEKE